MADPDQAPETRRTAETSPQSGKRKRAPPKPKVSKVEPVLDEAALLDGAPKPGSQARLFWEYGQAFARGMSRGSGLPCTAPAVKGPQDVMVRLMRAHGRAPDGSMLRGSTVLAWLEEIAFAFRSTADAERVRFAGGWTPAGLARWLDAGQPVTVIARQAGGSHIAIDRR